MRPPLINILKAILLTATQPLQEKALQQLFSELESEKPSIDMIQTALADLAAQLQSDVITLRKLASGYVLQVKEDFSPWVNRLTEEKPPRYSRALLETLAIIAYRQPITRSEIEAIRGIAVSTGIMRTLQEREWVRIIGHRDVPGKPAIYGTTAVFLDYFNCENLSDLPPIGDIKELTQEDIQKIEALIGDDLPKEALTETEGAAIEALETVCETEVVIEEDV